MIVKTHAPWPLLLFRLRGSSVEHTWPRILLVTVIATVITVTELGFGYNAYSLTTTPFTLVGLSLGIFLGFRNNASYDRFWEGRKLWGSLVNTTRTLTRQAYTLMEPGTGPRLDGDGTSGPGPVDVDAFRLEFTRRVIAFTHAVRHHLRVTDPLDDLRPLLPLADYAAVRDAGHRPVMILQQLGRDIADARRRGWLSEITLAAMDDQLTVLCDILGACERIKNTPIPFTYTLLIHHVVAIYCFMLPFGIVETAGWLTPVVTALIGHAFFGLDAIGEETEEPFGTDPNDLPLASISRNIEITLRELTGEPRAQLPKPLQPVDDILL